MLLVTATIVIAIWQYWFQKKSHEQKLLADREDRIINIYRVFADSGRVFISTYPFINIRMGLFPDIAAGVKRLQEYRIVLDKALDEAKLVFDDGAPIIDQLRAIYKKYVQLSTKEVELVQDIYMNAPNAKEILQKEFPNYIVNSMQDIWSNLELQKRFNELFYGAMEQELVKEIHSFRENDLSDANLDSYFKPYINRIPAFKKKKANRRPQNVREGK